MLLLVRSAGGGSAWGGEVAGEAVGTWVGCVCAWGGDGGTIGCDGGACGGCGGNVGCSAGGWRGVAGRGREEGTGSGERRQRR